MDGVVQRLRCRYRVPPEAAVAARVRGFDAGVRPRLEAALGEALDQAFAGDPAVYVVRRVRSAVTLPMDGGDDAVVRAWGERLAGAAVRTVADDPGDGANLVRFDDPADYVARFVGDLLRGRAWDRWYYLAFGRLRGRPRREALLAVLLDHRDELPAILALLERQGTLPTLLAALAPHQLAELWRAGLGGRAVGDPGGRPLFAAALDLLTALGLETPSGRRAQDLHRAWAEAAEAPEVDWRRPASLARGVASALAFLVDRGVVRVDHLAAASARLEEAAAGLGWLDGRALAAEVRLLTGAGDGGPARRGRPTPRLRHLLADLEAAAGEVADRLATAGSQAAAALILAAALYRRAPEWRGEAMAMEAVERFVAARTALAGLPAAAWLAYLEARGPLPDGTAGGALAAPPRRALLRLEPWGAEGAAVLRALLTAPRSPAARPDGAGAGTGSGRRPAVAGPEAEIGLETRAAGAFLLLRVLGDLGLPGMAGRVLVPASGVAPPGETPQVDARTHGSGPLVAAFVAALARRWAGIGPGDPDPGPALLAGLDAAEAHLADSAPLAAVPDDAWKTWQRRLQELAAAHRLAPEATLDLSADTRALFAERSSALTALAALTLDLTAALALRAWARWLRGFATSSVPFLLDSFVRRGGRLLDGRDGLRVELEARPLDLVLEMAGYLESVQSLDGRQVRFTLWEAR